MASGGVLRELLAVFSFGVDTKELKHGENALEEFGEKIKNIATAIAGAFAFHEIYEFAESNVKALTEIERTATQLGISTEKVQEFTYAAKSLGLESGQLLNLMGRLQISQQGAAGGSKQGAEAFKAIGVSAKDANGHFKTADELFLDVAEGISKQTDASKQAAIATQLFGRQGRTLLPFLKEGREGAEKLRERFKRLGGGFGGDTIKKAKEFEETMADMGLAMAGVKNKILAWLLPAITKLNDVVTKTIAFFGEVIKDSNLLQLALAALGVYATAFAVKMAIANAPLLLMVAGFLALLLVIDDVIGLFQGKKSAIGDFIDMIFGKDAHIEMVKTIAGLWHEIVEYIKEAAPYLEKIGSIALKIASLPFKAGAAIGDLAGRVSNSIKESGYSLMDHGAAGGFTSSGSLMPKMSGADWDAARSASSGNNINNNYVTTIHGVDYSKQDSVHDEIKRAAATYPKGVPTTK